MSALIIRGTVDAFVLPAFTALGSPLQMIWDPTIALMARVAAGERADGIVAIDWALDQLSGEGLIDSASRRPLARSAFGIAVAAGAPKPDISTVKALTQTLLAVPSVAYSRAGASGVYFERLINDLGIAEAVRAKAIVIPAGLTGAEVAAGRAGLAIQQVSELLAVPGVELVGPFPDAVQEITDFSAAIFTGAADPRGARRFIDLLLDREMKARYIAAGLKPRF